MSTDLALIQQTADHLALPENRYLVRQLPPHQLYALEQLGEIATEAVDDLVIGWAEEGKTQQWMADQLACSQQAVSKRMVRLGIKTEAATRGEGQGSYNRVVTTESDEVEEIEGAEVEIIDNDGPAAEYLPDLMAEDADQNLRTQVVRWFEIGRRINQMLDARSALNPKSPSDQKAIARDADLMVAIARRISKEAR